MLCLTSIRLGCPVWLSEKKQPTEQAARIDQLFSNCPHPLVLADGAGAANARQEVFLRKVQYLSCEGRLQ
jgi:hypothetical protein